MATKRDSAAAATRAKVTKAARECFTERGFEAVTVRDVAMRAGTSTGAIFSHFQGKEALFEGAMGRKPPLERVRQLLTEASTLGPSTVLPGWARELLGDLFGKTAS